MASPPEHESSRLSCVIIDVWDASPTENEGISASLEQGSMTRSNFCFHPCARVTVFEDDGGDIELTFECHHTNLEIQLSPFLCLTIRDPLLVESEGVTIWENDSVHLAQ